MKRKVCKSCGGKYYENEFVEITIPLINKSGLVCSTCINRQLQIGYVPVIVDTANYNPLFRFSESLNLDIPGMATSIDSLQVVFKRVHKIINSKS